MYKLTGHGLMRGEWFIPESQPMTLTERNSSCSITLGPRAPEIGFDDWILDDDWPEGPTVWRVRAIDNQVDKETVTVQMEHVIRRLEDIKLFAGASPADMGGGDTVAAKTAISWILSHQSDWRLGDFAYPADYALPYEFSGGESLLDAIESVTETLEDSEWWYDMSVYPFLLHIRRRSADAACEMRGGRNLSTLRRSMNRSGMYTRIYPVGRNDMHLPEEYLSQNEGVYGRVDKVETDQGKTSEAGLRAWAAGRLRRHCEPVVTVTISGLELSQETGEALDTITVNRVCRCPLPEYRTTILERVIKKAWRDRRADPESVTVTLGNNSADVTDLTKVLEAGSKTSGRSARGQAKQNYLFEANGEHLLYEVFDECGHLHGVLRMTEQSLRVAFENLNNCTRSEFKLTSESLRVQFENEIQCTRSELQMTSESLRVIFENDVASVRSSLEMTASSLRTQFTNDINSTRSEFQQTSESLRVIFENDVASVRSSLEMTASSLRTQFTNDINSTRSEFQQTSESMRISFANDVASVRSELQITASSLRVQFENDVSSVRSSLEMTASSLRTVFENDIASVRSEVTQTESSWKAAVAGVAGKDGKITAASIGVAINKDGSNAFINADHIHITGDTLLSGHLSVKDGHLSVDTALSVGNTIGKIVTINNGAINAPTVQVNSGGKLLLVGTGENQRTELTFAGIQEYIKKAELSTDGKTLKLYKVSDSSTPSITFSKATTLEGAWSGGKYTVDAYQTNNGTKTKVGSENTTITSVLANGAVTYENKILTVPIQVLAKIGTASAADTEYTQDFKVAAGLAYNAGWGAARDSVDGKYYTYDGKTYFYNPTVTVTDANRQEFIRVARPSLIVDDALEWQTYTLTNSGDKAQIREGGTTGSVVAELNHGTETHWKPAGVALTSDKKGVDVVNAAGVALTDAPFDISGAYNAGFDAIGSPTFEYTGIATGVKQASPVVTAKIADKTGGASRRQNFSMSLEENTTDHTAELKYGSSVIGRIDVTSVTPEKPTITYVGMGGNVLKESPEFTVSANGQSNSGWITMFHGTAQVGTETHNVINACKESDANTIIGRLDIQSICNSHYSSGYNAGYSAGAGSVTPEAHSTQYSLYCSKVAYSSGQYYNYTFSVTLPGNNKFSAGTTYNFWR